MADKIFFWDDSNSTAGKPISKGASFGIFKNFVED
jgi:hypothetical protein